MGVIIMVKKTAPAIKTKADVGMENILTRQNYLVVEANDLAYAFGRLTAFEQNVLDYAISFIQQGDTGIERYVTPALDVIHHLGLSSAGSNYKRVFEAFKALNEKTPVYILDGDEIVMTHMFQSVRIKKGTGEVSFGFTPDVQPFLFELKRDYHSFKLAELALLRSKHSKTLLRLWRTNQMGPDDKHVTISGTMEDWQFWFRGKYDKLWPAGQFNRDVLDKAMAELGTVMHVHFDLTKKTKGRQILGYDMTIHDYKSAVLDFGK